MLSQLLVLLIASVYLCSANPLISPPDTLVPRDDLSDCQNVTRGLNASCWDLVPPKVGMDSWLKTWNETTTTCQPGELWANCFMRLAGVPSNASNPIRCDLIGPDVCPAPSEDLVTNVTAEVAYGIASIWALQQYMTTLYQYLGDKDRGLPQVWDGFLGQPAPRSAKPILIDILSGLGDPVATNITKIIKSLTSPQGIGQASLIIPTQTLAPQIVGQTVGYLLQHTMKDWVSGNFSTLSVEGNLIAILADAESD